MQTVATQNNHTHDLPGGDGVERVEPVHMLLGHLHSNKQQPIHHSLHTFPKHFAADCTSLQNCSRSFPIDRSYNALYSTMFLTLAPASNTRVCVQTELRDAAFCNVGFSSYLC
jgi:hypothetical protein